MITKEKCFEMLREVIDVSIATVDKKGNPQVRIIDVMHISKDTIYFLTARGKNFYKELEENNNISIVGLINNRMIRIQAKAKKLEDQKKWIDLMFEENGVMNNVYPGDSRYILEPFCITDGEMEYFDLTQHPIYRTNFPINNGEISEKGFFITDNCISCGICTEKCPQKAITEGNPYIIQEEHCLHCGICYENCPNTAIIRK